MRFWTTTRLGVLAAGFALVCAAGAQTSASPPADGLRQRKAGQSQSGQSQTGQSQAGQSQAGHGQSARDQLCRTCTVAREIDDPSTGQHWLLMVDSAHPGGPGIFVAQDAVSYSPMLKEAIAQVHRVILAGDLVTLERSSAKVDVRLEGTALARAAAGAPLDVRLAMNGKVVRAIALGPGRAEVVGLKEQWQ